MALLVVPVQAAPAQEPLPTVKATAETNSKAAPAVVTQDEAALVVLTRLSGKSAAEVANLKRQSGDWQSVIKALGLDLTTVRQAVNKLQQQSNIPANTQVVARENELSKSTPPKTCECTTLGFLPLPELGTGLYQGKQGGLYPNGSSVSPTEHAALGMALARQVQPLDKQGLPDTVQGKIVFLTIGMSHTTQETQAFFKLVAQKKDINPNLVLVDGAQGGMELIKVNDVDNKGTGERYWNTIRQRLASAGVTPEQVQVVWLKQAVANPSLPWPADAESLTAQLRAIVIKIKLEYPNVKIAYVSSRSYAGYAVTKLNPEPYAYQSGFAVKWLIEEQINGSAALNSDPKKGEVAAPWLAWGPYLWADGLTPRADGLQWECADFVDDGTHPSSSGQMKVANLLMQFMRNESTVQSWFWGSSK